MFYAKAENIRFTASWLLHPVLQYISHWSYTSSVVVVLLSAINVFFMFSATRFFGSRVFFNFIFWSFATSRASPTFISFRLHTLATTFKGSSTTLGISATACCISPPWYAWNSHILTMLPANTIATVAAAIL